MQSIQVIISSLNQWTRPKGILQWANTYELKYDNNHAKHVKNWPERWCNNQPGKMIKKVEWAVPYRKFTLPCCCSKASIHSSTPVPAYHIHTQGEEEREKRVRYRNIKKQNNWCLKHSTERKKSLLDQIRTFQADLEACKIQHQIHWISGYKVRQVSHEYITAYRSMQGCVALLVCHVHFGHVVEQRSDTLRVAICHS